MSGKERDYEDESADGPARPNVVFALHLAMGDKIRTAARAAGIAEATAHRLKRDPDVVALVAELRSTYLDRCMGRLTFAAVKAVNVLVKKLSSADDRVVVRAAASILATFIKVKDVYDFDERLRALEERSESADNGRYAGRN